MSVKGRSKLYGPYRLSVIGAILRGPHRRPDRHRRLYSARKPALRASWPCQGSANLHHLRFDYKRSESRGGDIDLARVLERASWKRCHLNCVLRNKKRQHTMPHRPMHVCTYTHSWEGTPEGWSGTSSSPFPPQAHPRAYIHLSPGPQCLLHLTLADTFFLKTLQAHSQRHCLPGGIALRTAGKMCCQQEGSPLSALRRASAGPNTGSLKSYLELLHY